MYYKAKTAIISIPNMGYTKTAAKGVSWVWLLNLFTRGISLLSIIIIARILTPSDFGLYGIALLAMALLEVLTETGVNVVLIQKGGELDEYIDSAWIVSIARGIFIALMLILLAPIVSIFFNTQNSTYLLLLIAIVPFLRGFINPSIIKFQKYLDFQKEFWYKLSIAFFGAFVSLALVILTKSVASLIYGMIAGVMLEIIISFVFLKPRPHFKIHRDYFLQILNKGKWITLSGIFNYLFHNFDNIVIGKILGAGSLGLYQMAYRISMLPITDVADVISKVTFPVYTLISGDKPRLRKAFFKTILFISAITLPFGVILLFFPYQIIALILGQKWLGIVDVLRVLAIFGVIRAISGSTSALFLSLGKQKYITIVTLASMLGLGTTIIPLVLEMGIYGAGISALTGSLVALPFIVYFTVKILY